MKKKKRYLYCDDIYQRRFKYQAFVNLDLTEMDMYR
jgi:hypothetical protein